MIAASEIAWRRMTAFEVYLRTGRRDDVSGAVGPWSVKFNPWHDPRDGRFTFGPGGAAMGRRPEASPANDDPFVGGGGGFDGGGASGSWEPDASPERKPRDMRGGPVPSYAALETGSTHTVSRNGYNFTIDREGRTSEVSGPLSLGQSAPRSRSAQLRAGGTDRLTSDDGGHYIAARFNGPRDAFNHFAQNRNFNRGGYRALEDQWAREIRSGRSVKVDIVPSYVGGSQRPSRIRVSWWIGKRRASQIFSNRHGGE